jgi:predicted SAM-dependent methyltransferase
MKKLIKSVVSRRTRTALKFDRLRLSARLKHQRGTKKSPESNQLHFGCGARRVPGWLNVDVAGSECDVDLASPLPWTDASFDAVVSQQVIEHLELEQEFEPLLRELARVCRPDAEVWLACPDMERVCRSYLEDRGTALFRDRQTRHQFPWREGMPHSQMVNWLFHQGNEHRNLFDFELLAWVLEQNGFERVERTSEPEFLQRFPEFPKRNDDWLSLYVRARKPTAKSRPSPV